MISNSAKRSKFHVDISHIVHRGKERFLLKFIYERSLIQRIKGIEGRKYTKTYKGWHLPYEVNSLIKLSELNIEFSIEQSDKMDTVFRHYEEQIQVLLQSDCLSEKFIRKVGFLTETFAAPQRTLLTDYIDYLHKQGYSWTGIKYFAQYAVAYLEGEEKDFALADKYNLDITDYDRVREVFLAFRNLS